MVCIVSYKSLFLKVHTQLSLSDLNGQKYNVGCLPIAILLTRQIPIGNVYFTSG